MNLIFLVLFLAGIAGAVVFKKKNKKVPMIACIAVAAVSAVLLICAAWLMWSID